MIESRSLDAITRPLSHKQRARQAVFLCLREGESYDLYELESLSRVEWRQLLDWMDVSGLALYFCDHVRQQGLYGALPKWALGRLEQSAKENAQRTQGMVEESVAIQQAFQDARISYAVVKGLSLWPVSVPRPELRHQFDLDYLVAEDDAEDARRILERWGYHLFAMGAKSWEFKINETPYVSVKDLYKDNDYRAVELHLEPAAGQQGTSRLERVVHREMFGIAMPMFSSVDLFVGQVMHAFKDVCSAFSRSAHLLECYRHVIYRRDNPEFWKELRESAQPDRRTCLGIGVVMDLLRIIMGDFAPEELTEWTADVLPPGARLWVRLYGHRVVFGKHPGTKLHLILQMELAKAGLPARTPVRKSLVPSKLPPPVVRGSSGESLLTSGARYAIQVRFVFSRARFHVVEGIRYMAELYRWRHRLERFSA